MEKPTLFIGSSTEQMEVAAAIQSAFTYDAQPFVWTQGVFGPSQYPLESLEDALNKADFAVFVCAADDRTKVRRKQLHTVRDNVIFELGMSIGRLTRARTFLISPRGAKPDLPSDLSGLTPETFEVGDKLGLQAALGPACNNIRIVMQRLGPLIRASNNDTSDTAGTLSLQYEEPAANPLEPNIDWTIEAYEFNYFIALIRNESSSAIRIDEAFAASAHSNQQVNLAIWRARKERAAMMAEQPANVALLRDLVANFPAESQLHDILGQALRYYGDQEGAIKEFISAAEIASSPTRMGQIVERALELEGLKVGSPEFATIKKLLVQVAPEIRLAEPTLVRATEKIALAEGQSEIGLALAEYLISLEPENTSSRFNLAWRYSEANQDKLSLLHYEAIPSSERSGMVWNNLGVSYGKLQMTGKATCAFQDAERKQETIAYGNLANKLIGAGFFAEAQEKAEAAIGFEHHHENVVTVLSSIASAQHAENQTRDAAVIFAQNHQVIRRNIGKAALSHSGPDIAGIWDTADGPVNVSDNGDGTYTGFGEAIRENNAIGLGYLSHRKRVEKHQVQVTLKRLGNAFEGTSVWEASEKGPGLLGLSKTERKILMAVSDDGSVISGLEIYYDSKEVEWTKHTNNQTEVRLLTTQGLVSDPK
jgi:tetratricopeptide (TPR) repeat protein